VRNQLINRRLKLFCTSRCEIAAGVIYEPNCAAGELLVAPRRLMSALTGVSVVDAALTQSDNYCASCRRRQALSERPEGCERNYKFRFASWLIHRLKFPFRSDSSRECAANSFSFPSAFMIIESLAATS
jgi:hypothetical protein